MAKLYRLPHCIAASKCLIGSAFVVIFRMYFQFILKRYGLNLNHGMQLETILSDPSASGSISSMQALNLRLDTQVFGLALSSGISVS